MSDPEDFDDQKMDVDEHSAQGDAKDNDSNESNDGDDDSGDSDIDAEVKLYEKYAEILTHISAASHVYDHYVQLVEVAQ